MIQNLELKKKIDYEFRENAKRVAELDAFINSSGFNRLDQTLRGILIQKYHALEINGHCLGYMKTYLNQEHA